VSLPLIARSLAPHRKSNQKPKCEQNANQNQRPGNSRVDSSHPWVVDKKKNGINAEMPEMPEMEGKNRAAVKKKKAMLKMAGRRR
jgi:hypothetical protein